MRRIYGWGRSCAAWFQVVPDFGCFSAVKSALSIFLLDPSVERCGVLVDDSRVTEGCVQIRRCAEPYGEGGQEPLHVWSSSGGRNSMCPSHEPLCSGLVSALQVTSCSYRRLVAVPWEDRALASRGAVQGKLFLHPGRMEDIVNIRTRELWTRSSGNILHHLGW